MAVALTNAGGVLSNASSLDLTFSAQRCNDANCGTVALLPFVPAYSDSTLTGTPLPAAAIPLPAGLPLLLGGVAALTVLRRGRR